LKNYFKGISITLISAMLFTLLPVQVLAAGTSKPSIDPAPVVDQSQKAEAKIIGEITDKRDINIKHFRKDDLTFEADVFPFAVHYQKDGKWQDIWCVIGFASLSGLYPSGFDTLPKFYKYPQLQAIAWKDSESPLGEP